VTTTPGTDRAPRRSPDGAGSGPDDLVVTCTPTYRVVSLVTRSWLRLYHRLRVDGSEHFPATGGVLLVANHASFLDIPAVAATTRRHVAFVARDSLAHSRPLAFVMRGCGAILLRRGAADRRALRAMAAHLEAGDVVAVFPEGTRSLDGELGEFRAGALIAARQTGAPIVPVAVRGTFRALRRGARFPRPVRIEVRLGAPIAPEFPDALARAHAAIGALLGPGAASNS